MLAVKINNLSYQINNNDILQNVSLELEQDKIACVLGPSGLSLIHISEPTRPY